MRVEVDVKLSVIIPCHNAAPYLAQTIGSALAQTRPPDEIIVVDDGSTDESAAIARECAVTASTVRVVQAGFGRASMTRNVGAHEASGDALMFLDADDMIGPDTLEALSDAVTREPNAVAICPWFRLERHLGAWHTRPPSCRSRRSEEDALAAWLTGWYHPPCAVLWSRAAFDAAGRWDDLATVNDDGDLMMRALVGGVTLIETAAGAGYYRRRPEDESSLSGTRLTEDGLASRLRIITKIAFRLECQRQLAPYGRALASALDLLAEEAGRSHPAIRREARALARRYRAMRSNRAPRPRVAGAASGVARSHAVATDRPVVSVVVPTYNRARVLPRAIECVLGQSCGDLELLIVDDGSTDDTEAAVSGYTDPRVRYLREPINRGTSAARNVGLREARGTFVAFLDSDDEWLPDKLTRQLAVFASRGPETGLVYTGVERVESDGQSTIQRPRARGEVYRELLWRNAIHGGGSNVMMRRNAVASTGFFNETLKAIEDYEYWLRIARFFSIEFVDAPLVRYYDRPDAGRRSLALRANLDARWWLYETYAQDMRRAGVAHLFLLNTARWALLYGGAEVSAVRPLLLRAVREKPTSRMAIATLLGTSVPGAAHMPWVHRHAVVKQRWASAF